MIGGEHMKTRRLGKTGLMVSEIGFGGEWLERHTETEGIELIRYASEKGINILDCWMADPKSRNIIGEGIKENRDQWFIQGHIGSTWKDGQYFRTREMKYVRPAFEDLLKRLQTDYIDLGMIHYVDSEEEWEKIQHSDYLDYVMELKESTATVAEAAEALDVKPGMIAKTMSFLQGEKAVLILTEGTAKVDNHKYKDTFHVKAKMIPFDQVEARIGHAPGGVCPFGINEGIEVYLDDSLKQFTTVYPAAGNDHSAVKLTIPELEQAAGAKGWVDVTSRSTQTHSPRN